MHPLEVVSPLWSASLGAAGVVVATLAGPALLDSLAVGCLLGFAAAGLVVLWSRSTEAQRLGRLDALAPVVEELAESESQGVELARRIAGLPEQISPIFESIESSAATQEATIEEAASLLAHMRASMTSIAEQVEQLLSASDESTASVAEMAASIEEVALNMDRLHEVVEASTASVHEMGASIRQVAEGAEQVQQMAEGTAASVVEMDRSIQEVSEHAHEAASLTRSAHAGAESGAEAVRATIDDIEEISQRTTEAKERLSGLVARVSQIADILAAIDEINDETKLLSLNAAIIAAQAGEHGKPFLVVANHVKTLARRTAGSTQDIERLIADIELDSGGAVRAMEAGITAVRGGVVRSQATGDALSAIQDSCRDARERVDEIARATAEQSRNSKGVAEATQQTSLHVQQISQAMAEQRRASEEMLAHAESALASGEHVHRSTEAQRGSSRILTQAIAGIRDRVRQIGEQTTVHKRASEDVAAAVISLLENAQHSGETLEPIRQLLSSLAAEARQMADREDVPSVGRDGGPTRRLESTPRGPESVVRDRDDEPRPERKL